MAEADLDLLDLTPEHIEELGPLRFAQPMRTREMCLHDPWGIRVGPIRYLVPKGMHTDGASIPRALWRVMDPPFYSLLTPAGIIHDGGYKGLLRVLAEDGTELPAPDRAETDALFRVLGIWNGYTGARAWAAYQGVHWFGGPAWKSQHALYETIDRKQLVYLA